MTAPLRPGVVYSLNGTEYLCEKIKPDGSVWLKAVQMKYGNWVCCHGTGSAWHLRHEYDARPVRHQRRAKARLWASWHVAPRLRRLRRRVGVAA